MRLLRWAAEKEYDVLRPRLLRRIQKRKRYLEIAHQNFIDLSQFLWKKGLTNLLLDSPENYLDCKVKFANAAGSNKNGDIPPVMWKALGMDIVNIGSVTYDPWDGNTLEPVEGHNLEQRIWDHGWMFMENNLGLPGIGAPGVKRNLERFGSLDEYHIRINWMSTPKKIGDGVIEDIVKTVYELRDFADSWELNISCPNTQHEGGEDTRRLYQDSLNTMLKAVTPLLHKPLYLKISPDIDREGVKQILEVCSHYNIAGFTISNTTRQHKNPYGKVYGGGSGDYVYPLAMKAQELFAEEIAENYSKKQWKINACGGISTVERADERIQIGNVKEIHLYTPLIFKGPKIMREFRRGLEV